MTFSWSTADQASYMGHANLRRRSSTPGHVPAPACIRLRVVEADHYVLGP